MFRQSSSFMDSHLVKQQCGFRKGYSTQYCLFVMLEKWKNSVDKGKSFGALLTAFDYLFQELLIAKLSTYGFDFSALKLIQKLPVEQKTKDQSQYDL